MVGVNAGVRIDCLMICIKSAIGNIIKITAVPVRQYLTKCDITRCGLRLSIARVRVANNTIQTLSLTIIITMILRASTARHCQLSVVVTGETASLRRDGGTGPG